MEVVDKFVAGEGAREARMLRTALSNLFDAFDNEGMRERARRSEATRIDARAMLRHRQRGLQRTRRRPGAAAAGHRRRQDRVCVQHLRLQRRSFVAQQSLAAVTCAECVIVCDVSEYIDPQEMLRCLRAWI